MGDPSPARPRSYDADDVEVLGPSAKGVPVDAWGSSGRQLVDQGRTLGAMPTPLLTLDRGAVAGNVAAMAAWTRGAGVALAPHGKTTMAPSLWRQQLDAGAWGITVATPWQLLVALEHGVPQILMAYNLVHPEVLEHLATTPRTARVAVWVDGTEAVVLMSRHLAGAAQPLDVLVELGAPGGRTGARSAARALEVARAVREAPGLRLAGVGGYEGALAHDAGPGSLDVVRGYLEELAGLHAAVLDDGLAADPPPGGVLLTAGGSAYFDLVAQVLAPLHDPDGARGAPVHVLVRAGAYVAHDDGFYRGITPMARGESGRLVSAIHGWGRVLSRPEPDLALLDAGKRDLPFDEGLPEVQAVRAQGTGPTTALHGARVTALNDQHTFVRLEPEAQHVAVGDVLRLGLSHPCTAFDKWQLVPVVDDAHAEQPVVVDLVRTCFG